MKMKKLLTIGIAATFLVACGDKEVTTSSEGKKSQK